MTNHTNNGNHFVSHKNKENSASNPNLDSDLEDLEKEFSIFAKKMTPEISLLGEKLNEIQTALSKNLESIDNMQAQLEQLQSSQKTNEQQLENLLEFQTSISGEVTKLTESVTNITDVVIPNLESQIGQSGGEEEWVTLYDMRSDDPELNKGETSSGLTYETSEAIIGDIDFGQYNVLRFKLCSIEYEVYYEINISEFKNVDTWEYAVRHIVNSGEVIVTIPILQTHNNDAVHLMINYSHRTMLQSRSPYVKFEYRNDLYYFTKLEARK